MGCETKAAHVPALSPGQELFVRIGLDWSGKYSFFSSRFGESFFGNSGNSEFRSIESDLRPLLWR